MKRSADEETGRLVKQSPDHDGARLDQCLQRLTDCLMQVQYTSAEGPKCHIHSFEVIGSRLCAIVSRSKEALTDFGEFYCSRLVLDLHSPLASFFIGLFSHLEFLLLQLQSILNDVRKSIFADEFYLLNGHIHQSLSILKPVTSTCRLLYATCNMLPCMIPAPAAHVGDERANEEFKRQGQRQGRRFSSNLLHSRMQHMAYVSLDQPGCSRVNLVQKLGEGTFATVYKGIFELPPAAAFSHRMRPGHFVAVKMFNKDGGAEYSAHGNSFTAPPTSVSFGSQLRRSMQQITNRDPICGDHDNVILEELEKLVVAKHPNIVTPRGYIGERTEGECGLVMELMDESLFDYLEKVLDGCIPPLKEVDMLDLMLEIARGMQFLHECELIHLDLKPSNVLLRFCDGQDHPPQVKIADLGLTKLSSLFRKEMNAGYEDSNMVSIGTSCYMAPELRHGSSHSAKCDDKVDVFSFGTTCFNILLGNPNACAFAGSIANFYTAIEAGEWQQWVQDCNPFLVRLVGRCWEMDPSMRPTFATLCVLLQHAMETHLAANAAQLSPRPSSTSESGWSGEHKDVEEPPDHLQVYAAVSKYCRENSDIGIGFNIMKREVMQFESQVKANADMLSLDTLFHSWMEKLLMDHKVHENLENERLTVRTFKEWKVSLRKGNLSMSLKKARHVNLQFTIMENCLDFVDPLVFLKMQAYVNLLTFKSGFPIWKVLGNLSVLIEGQWSAIDFSSDAAHASLQVDTSLISLLISFWNFTIAYW